MIARRLPSILPPLEPEEAIEVTRIQSVAGVRGGGGLVTARPFRAPHHTISAAGLVGGADPPQPGEATLAHRGVLFLDELSEFARPSLEALRQPLEDGHVTIVRGQQVMVFPTRFMLVAASNPCPCGLGGDALHAARRPTSPATAAGSRGPLLDRIDILMRVERPAAEALRDAGRAVLGRRPRARRRRPRAPGAPARRPARDLQRPADVAQIREVGRDHAERAPRCSASSTTATRSRPAATTASCASPARSPTSRAVRRRRPGARQHRRQPALRDGRPLAEAA